MKKNSLLYLASPYSHKDPIIQEQRFLQVCACAAHLIQKGYYIYSPIIHNHPLAKIAQLPRGFTYWQAFDIFMLTKCDGLLICCIPGWGSSKGVQEELKYATEKLKLICSDIIYTPTAFCVLYK